MKPHRHIFIESAISIVAIAAIIALGNSGIAKLGVTGTALLLLLPVLWAASRTNAGIGSALALVASIAFNYFMLPPLYTFVIDGPTYIVIFVVFLAVALVTGGFAAGLRARQKEAMMRAEEVELENDFLSEISRATDLADLDEKACAYFSRKFGEARMFSRDALIARDTGLAPLDAAAAAWALDNNAIAGHASDVMPSADFRFLSFGRGGNEVLALSTRTHADTINELFLARLAAHWGQARDRLILLAERERFKEAELRDRTRRTLLSTLGHDFRTPLTVLKEGLARLPGARKAGLSDEVERLQRMGENLLASARLDAGLALALEPIDLIDSLADLEQRFAGLRADKKLVVSLPDDLPFAIAEPTMLGHLLGNVVENALRHSEQRVDVIARVKEDHLLIEISDDGPGVPKEQAQMIFEPFVSGRTEMRGSSGLGLSIARDLAAAMSGQLTLLPASEAQGATFRLLLPMAPTRDIEA